MADTVREDLRKKLTDLTDDPSPNPNLRDQLRVQREQLRRHLASNAQWLDGSWHEFTKKNTALAGQVKALL